MCALDIFKSMVSTWLGVWLLQRKGKRHGEPSHNERNIRIKESFSGALYYYNSYYGLLITDWVF